MRRSYNRCKQEAKSQRARNNHYLHDKVVQCFHCLDNVRLFVAGDTIFELHENFMYFDICAGRTIHQVRIIEDKYAART
jgi:cupin superfamily acireductone dioxygenase involved in methionine salvage